MPARTLTIDGQEWQVFPSGFLTANPGDEFGLIFVTTTDGKRVVRVTRYSPLDAKRREQSLASLSEAELRELFGTSQPGDRSPEAGYRQ